jgi:hypothetical protein
MSLFSAAKTLLLHIDRYNFLCYIPSTQENKNSIDLRVLTLKDVVGGSITRQDHDL